MHSLNVLKAIHAEHGYDARRLAETLLLAGVPMADVELLRLLPWPYLANCIALERERVGLSAVHPLLDWKLPPPPPAWLTPAMCKKLFEPALEFQDDEADAGPADGRALVLPA